MPAGERLKYRSNVPEYSKYVFEPVDTEFPSRCSVNRDNGIHNVIVAGLSYGQGSSREHAPWGLEVNDITLVIATNYARIFRQNMYNCGLMAVELSEEQINGLFDKYAGKEVEVDVNVADAKLTFKADGEEEVVEFTLEGFDRALVEAGGSIEYADAKY